MRHPVIKCIVNINYITIFIKFSDIMLLIANLFPALVNFAIRCNRILVIAIQAAV